MKDYIVLMNALKDVIAVIVKALKAQKINPDGEMHIEFKHVITEDRGAIAFTKISTIHSSLQHLSNGNIGIKSSTHNLKIFRDAHSESIKTYDETFNIE